MSNDDLLDSIHMSLSLEMQSMNERTENSNLKHVKMSLAFKKASVNSFNEHLENATRHEAYPTVTSLIYEDLNEMPSNR